MGEEPKAHWIASSLASVSQRSLEDRNRIVIANPIEGVDAGFR
jgi:hypothetical protein